MSSGPPRTIQRNMVPVLARMFNNPEFSNLKILVNNDTFYAEKNFLRVSSLVWEVLLGSLASTHRMIEYRIDRIRDSESILTILKFVYGVPINFTRLPDLVLLEVVGLADMLLYMEFHKDLLAYIEKHRPQLIGAELPPREEIRHENVEASGGETEGSGSRVESSGEVVEGNMQVEEIGSELVEARGAEVVGNDIEHVERNRGEDEESGSQVVGNNNKQVVGNNEQQTDENNSEALQVTRDLENFNLNSDNHTPQSM